MRSECITVHENLLTRSCAIEINGRKSEDHRFTVSLNFLKIKEINMNKCQSKRSTLNWLVFILVICSLFLTFGCSTNPAPQKPLIITGVVTDYQNNAPARNIEVQLYTYHPNPLIEYLPPTGHIIDSVFTTEQGKYQLQVDADLFARLEKLGYDKLVVFVAQGISGFKVINLSDGTVEVNLITGAPAPAGTK